MSSFPVPFPLASRRTIGNGEGIALTYQVGEATQVARLVVRLVWTPEPRRANKAAWRFVVNGRCGERAGSVETASGTNGDPVRGLLLWLQIFGLGSVEDEVLGAMNALLKGDDAAEQFVCLHANVEQREAIVGDGACAYTAPFCEDCGLDLRTLDEDAERENRSGLDAEDYRTFL